MVYIPHEQMRKMLEYLLKDASAKYSTDPVTLVTLSVLFGVTVILMLFFWNNSKRLY